MEIDKDGRGVRTELERAIEIAGLSKVYSSVEAGAVVEAIRDIDLTIFKGELFTIIGPSGCGKSTLLNILAGLIPKSSGKVLIGEEEVTGPNPNAVAVVFQEHALLPWRTVLENVEFGLEVKGLPRPERRKRALAYIELVGLKGFERRYPHELSGGMNQRAALTRALALETEIILMDEPFGALDEQTRLILGDELVNIWQRTGKTIVLVTHSLQEAAYLSDRIAVITARPGRVREIIKVDIPRPRRIDFPDVNEIRGRLWRSIAEDARLALVKGLEAG